MLTSNQKIQYMLFAHIIKWDMDIANYLDSFKKLRTSFLMTS